MHAKFTFEGLVNDIHSLRLACFFHCRNVDISDAIFVRPPTVKYPWIIIDNLRISLIFELKASQSFGSSNLHISAKLKTRVRENR